jgi:hypothetical protein
METEFNPEPAVTVPVKVPFHLLLTHHFQILNFCPNT